MGAMKGQVQSAAVQMKLSNTQQNMVESLADASKAMGNMNATMDPAKMAKTMNEFQIQNEKMDLKQEMMDDALDNLFDDDDIEGEADAVTQQVLDEIGVEVSSQMGAASSGVLKQARCMLICRSNMWFTLPLSFHAAGSATQHPAANHDANSASVMCMPPQLYSKQGLLTAIPVYAYTEESGTRGDRRGRRRSLCASGCAQELNS